MNPYPNTELDLFCSDNLSFQCMAPSTWLTNLMHGSKYITNHQLEKDVGCKVLQFINTIKITKLLDYKTLWCTNVAAPWRRWWTKAYVFVSYYACEKPLHLVALWRPLKQSLYMFRVVRKESPNIYSRIGVKSDLENWFL